MDTNQINRLLSSDPYTKRYFLGTFPCDQLPQRLPHTFSLVVNTDGSDEPGSHWQSIFGRGDIVYFMDSYGNPPKREILKFCRQFPHIFYNAMSHQRIDTKTCGGFALFQIYNQSRGVSFEKVVDTFVKIENDCDYINSWLYEKFHFVIP